ncbi:hypothetical protein EC968_008105 [Mortierella alpina]|nr:hypothetical protein EC968_008105 [Mortierella alpina]
MQVGRFGAALTKMATHWSPADCLAIVDRGMSLFLHALSNDVLLHEHALRHEVTQAVVAVAAMVSERDIDQQVMSAQKLRDELAPLQASIEQTTGLAPDLPGVDWKEGYYDRVRVNAWFWAVGAQFHCTKKLSVYFGNNDPARRSRHVAYVVCYFNTFRTRQLMGKLLPGDVDDHAVHTASLDQDNMYRLSHALSGPQPIAPLSATLPRCFKQDRSGSCSTMVLVNFLLQQSADKSGHVMSQFMRGQVINETSVQRSRLWRNLHHMYLCAEPKEQDETIFLSEGQEQVSASASASTSQPMQGPTQAVSRSPSPAPSSSDVNTDVGHDTTGNHIVLNVPYSGHVYELDSYPGAESCRYIGPVGTDWTVAAQVRLQQWSEAAHLTTVHNDVHAYVRDN